MKKLYVTVVIILLLFSVNVFADSSDIVIKQNGDTTIIDVNNNKIVMQKNKNLLIKYNNEVLRFLNDEIGFTYTGFSEKDIQHGNINVLRGQQRNNEDYSVVVSDGAIEVDTNLGKFFIDNKDIIFTTKSNTRFSVKNGEVIDFTNDLNKIENNSIKDNYELNQQILKEISEINKRINKYDDYNNNTQKRIEQLESRLSNISLTRETRKNEQKNTKDQVIPKNIEIKTGNLIMNVMDSQNVSDIYVDIAKKELNSEVITFYLSKKNNWECELNLETGDYTILDVYFLDKNFYNKYYFEHNDLIKILNTQTVWFEIRPKSIEKVRENINTNKDIKVKQKDLEKQDFNKKKNSKVKKTIINIIVLIGLLVSVFVILKKTGILKKIFIRK